MSKISNIAAARILVTGLVCGFLWLGVAAAAAFMERQSYFAKTNR